MTASDWVTECMEWATCNEGNGTPFRWQGRIKGDGADCWGLVIGAAKVCGYIPDAYEFNRYNKRDDLAAMAQGVLGEWFEDVTGQDIETGDILGFHHGHGIIHLAVVYNHPDGGFGIVHTEDYQRVVAHGLTTDAAKLVAQVWRPRYQDGKQG